MTDTLKDEKSRNAVGGSSPYVLAIVIERVWAGLPGAVLRFPCRMYLSGEVAARREQTIGLTEAERKEYLLDFRIRVLADVLESAPEGFPDFPEEVEVKAPGASAPAKSKALPDRAYAFFTREDAQGRRVFGLLVEDVMREYWNRAIPDPISPASASSPGGRDTSITS